MEQPKFTNSELFTIEGIVKAYKEEHINYFDEDGLLEIDDILSKLEAWRKEDHAWFKAFHNLTHEEQIQ